MNGIQAYMCATSDGYQGVVDPRFMTLAQHFSRLQQARAAQGGAALVVYFQGQKVVDIYMGQASAVQEWQSDTLSVCYSTGKGVLATLAHILVSAGYLDYDTPVVQYWPEFGQNGKHHITLRHILSHQSGIYDIRNLIDTAAEMADWPHMLEKIAQATPRFDVASDAAYQALTFGWLLGGVLEKATQQTLADLMQHYLVQPLQLDGAYFGVPSTQLPRVARPLKNLSTIKKTAIVQKSKKHKVSIIDRVIQWSGQNPQDFQDAMIPKAMKDFSFFSDQGLMAIIPAANGVFTAQSLAKIYAMLANKGLWQGQQLISTAVFEALSHIQYTERDRIMPIPMHWRLGYHRILSLGKRTQGFGHIGFNGSGAWCDPNRHLSFAYTHNFATSSISGDYRLWGLTQETLRCADQQLKGRKGWF